MFLHVKQSDCKAAVKVASGIWLNVCVPTFLPWDGSIRKRAAVRSHLIKFESSFSLHLEALERRVALGTSAFTGNAGYIVGALRDLSLIGSGQLSTPEIKLYSLKMEWKVQESRRVGWATGWFQASKSVDVDTKTRPEAEVSVSLKGQSGGSQSPPFLPKCRKQLSHKCPELTFACWYKLYLYLECIKIWSV